MAKTEKLTFTLYTYDLWSDGEGGMEVNDVYYQGNIEVTARIDPRTGWHTITDRQLNRAIHARGLKWDGDEEYTLYAVTKKGTPACELRRIK